MFVLQIQSMPGASIDSIIDFLEPLNLSAISNDEGFQPHQIGSYIMAYEFSFPDISAVDLIIMSCGDYRGAGIAYPDRAASDFAFEIRQELYNLFYWHKDLKIADIGSVKKGATLQDTYAAIKAITYELLQAGKRVLLLGGGHDLMMAQYEAYAAHAKIIEATNIDACINMDKESRLPAENFLLEMFTCEPNFLKHYNHIGFQSYFVHPGMLETIDKLRFDCYRVGKVKESIDEMEPVIRLSNLVGFDISAIQHSHAPCNHATPNGFSGEEACQLMRYTGMSHLANAIGIYGYHADKDVHQLTAKQISQMIWYLIDGIYKGRQEAAWGDQQAYSEYRLVFADIETVFWQSRLTERWWMQLPDGNTLACSRLDYLTATKNQIPERWMRAVERI